MWENFFGYLIIIARAWCAERVRTSWLTIIEVDSSLNIKSYILNKHPSLIIYLHGTSWDEDWWHLVHRATKTPAETQPPLTSIKTWMLHLQFSAMLYKKPMCNNWKYFEWNLTIRSNMNHWRVSDLNSKIIIL